MTRFREVLCIRNKYYISGAILLFLFAGFYLACGVSPLRESVTHYLTGEGAWGVEFDESAPGYRQIFVPAYTDVRQIGFVTEWESAEDEESDEAVTVELADGDGNVLKKIEIVEPQLKSGIYTKVPLGTALSRGKSYELRFVSHMGADVHPLLYVCGREYELKENRQLTKGNESVDAQIVAEYSYDNALPFGRYLKAMALVLAAACGIAIGTRKNRWVRLVAAGVLLAAGPVWLGRSLELLLPTNVLLPHAMKWNLALMYLFEVIVLLLTQSYRFTLTFCNIVLTILYCANYFVHAFRGTYLKLHEFAAVGTAANVVGKYELKPTPEMTMCICAALVLVCWGMGVGRVGKGDEGTADKVRAAGGTGVSDKVRAAGGTGVSDKAGAAGGKEVSETEVTEGTLNGQKWTRDLQRKIVSHIFTAAAAVALAALAGHIFVETDFFEAHGFSYYSGINQEYTYYFDGYLVGSMINIRYNRIVPPEGYSAKKAVEILERYKEDSRKDIVGEEAGGSSENLTGMDLPHIILIMNESYSDLRVNGNLELSRENLSVLHSLRENTIQGYVNASVLGGGTANSEFEVFSGCSMAFLPDSYYAYEQAVNRPLDSMITNLKNCGYKTYSMHPEKATNWRRNEVYRYLGFDESLWKEDFDGAEVIHSGVSDAATFEKVEELFENRDPGEKMFIFDLTMQNHGYYLNSHVKRTVEAVNVDCDEADIYLSLIYETDRAFGELVRYFAAQDEKVIICMFGDHQPKFFAEDFYEQIYRQTPGLGDNDKILNRYKTPFVIWANYDIGEAEDVNIGMSYLGVLLQETAGVPLTPFGSFLKEEMAQYPVITVNGYVDKNGNYENWSGDESEFGDYRILQYHYLFDR